MNAASQMILQADFCVLSRMTGRMKGMYSITSPCTLVNVILVFEKGYVILQSLFMTIIFLDASTLKQREMQVILNMGFLKVLFLLRYDRILCNFTIADIL